MSSTGKFSSATMQSRFPKGCGRGPNVERYAGWPTVLSLSQSRHRAHVFPLYSPKGFAVTSECPADHHRSLQHGLALLGGTRDSPIASMRVDGGCGAI